MENPGADPNCDLDWGSYKMALLDLSEITRSIIRLLEKHIPKSSVWPAGAVLSVLPSPPDMLTGDNTLGVYLYHLGEDPANKNLPAQWDRPDHIRYAPMPLILYYQICPHSDLIAPIGTYREQILMGCALKALHDYPVINDDTQVDGTDILSGTLKNHDNRFAIELRPTTTEESTHLWSTGSKPLRLSAYYQVSVILLEPETTTSRASRVLVYNAFAFPGETPSLVSSNNTISFTFPGESASRQVSLQPAQVPFGESVRLEGSGLTGDFVSLLINQTGWEKPLEVDGATWSVQASPTQVLAVIQDSAAGETLTPGLYGALVKVVRRRTIAGGGSRDFEYYSNETPFTISPTAKLTMTTAVDAVVQGRLYQGSGILPAGIRLYIGGNLLKSGTPGALAAGEYSIDSAVQISLKLPAGLTPGTQVPFRLIVNGAESPPAWIQVP